ncbi:MAG TPA: Lon family ATP-dependent protease [Bacillota bacterium]|nr:Lon family ATP-dependent protease [Bacillota bacterium]HPT86693.1 Lon family ATP-dependent protease [Bacillota bacterium]
MKKLFQKLTSPSKLNISLQDRLDDEEQLGRQVSAIFALLANLYGSDKLVLKAGKLEALKLMRSSVLGEKILALQRIVFEDPTIENPPKPSEIPEVLNEIEEEIADLIARKTVEEKIEKKIAERMQERHEEYLKEIKSQVLRESAGPENPMTLKKLADLERLEEISLSKSALEKLRPTKLQEVVGQERAVKALLSKLASPFPQHVILYGPPGVGKTTVARLVLEEAKKLPFTPFREDAPFVEVDGTTLRWDPREVTNPLLGSVHDPIYQGARRDLAEGGVPEPKPGLVTEAHGGVLFIDEIGEMDPMLLNKLLKVLEDKRVTFDSAYFDPNDPNVPKYIKKLFTEGAPADFVLVSATTRDPSEINPAIRSRCAEVFFEPLDPADIVTIVQNAAQRLDVVISPENAALISEYTIEGRKAAGILSDAYGLALYKHSNREGADSKIEITREDLLEIFQASRFSPYVQVKASDKVECGKVFGLGVSGFVGSVLEIEAISFPAAEKGKGRLRFNETAGSMAKDSVFNAASVVRLVTGLDLADFDVHVNIVGGGRIDGPSAGAAITLAIISCLTQRPIYQNIAITGEISVRGRVKAVGGIIEKIYGARQAGMKRVLIPKENEKDKPVDISDIEIITVDSISEMMEWALQGVTA